MIIRISLALLAAICLLGCGKEAPTAIDTKANPNTEVSAPATVPAVPAATGTNTTSGWKTTASGLKYQVIKQGTGTVSPKATDTVKVHYHGTLLDGTVFDSSVQRGEPLSFKLNDVIPGWTEGLQLMKVGDKFKFEIPANLAYGDKSPTDKIPPNSPLVFEVELLAIQ
jgi:FKBP-type peptidyl-prolyl cis-trans isomerase